MLYVHFIICEALIENWLDNSLVILNHWLVISIQVWDEFPKCQFKLNYTGFRKIRKLISLSRVLTDLFKFLSNHQTLHVSQYCYIQFITQLNPKIILWHPASSWWVIVGPHWELLSSLRPLWCIAQGGTLASSTLL